MSKEAEQSLTDIASRIFVVRGKRVLLDSELAKLYGVETRVLNQAVRRNRERFPGDFVLDLTNQEVMRSRSQSVILNVGEPDLERWEERVEHDIRKDSKIPDTQREAIILARVGQGKFRANVQSVERACRVTKVERLEHLVASHTKPWRDSTNEERLDGENGLLLTPTIDHLFDKGFISFEDKGDLIVSPVADRTSLVKMGIMPEEKVNVGVFSEGQRVFLEYHRENVLRMSRRR